MEPVEILRLLAAAATVAGALMVALNWSARVTVGGFGVLSVAALLWIVAGWIGSSTSLVFQNGVLLLINLAGVYRWAPRVP